MLDKLGRFDESVAASGEACALRPEWAEAHYNMGQTYDDMGRLESAIVCYENACRLRYVDRRGSCVGVVAKQAPHPTSAIKTVRSGSPFPLLLGPFDPHLSRPPLPRPRHNANPKPNPHPCPRPRMKAGLGGRAAQFSRCLPGARPRRHRLCRRRRAGAPRRCGRQRCGRPAATPLRLHTATVHHVRWRLGRRVGYVSI